MKKKNEIIIETPEKIHFTYRIAEIGTRISAYVIDEIVQIIIVIIIALPLIIGGYSIQTSFDKNINNLTAAFFLIMIFLFRWFYFVLFEVIMEGQSPGKRAMRIRVIRDNGDALDFATIILRNFLRIIDGFPIIPLVGGFIALIDSKNRRLGDLVANTIVVNEIYFDLQVPDFQVNFRHEFKTNHELVTMKRRLNENELYIIRRFLNEYYKLPTEKQKEIAATLANQVRKRLGIEEEISEAFLFLERIYQQHAVSNEK